LPLAWRAIDARQTGLPSERNQRVRAGAISLGGFFTVSAIRNLQIAKEKKSLMDGKKVGGWVSVHGEALHFGG